MSNHCKARTQGGKPCQAKPLRGKSYCFTHDPANARARAAARRKGGERTRINHGAAVLPAQVETIHEAREILRYVMGELMQHENSLQRARILLALHDSFIKSLEIGELEERIAALEALKNG